MSSIAERYIADLEKALEQIRDNCPGSAAIMARAALGEHRYVHLASDSVSTPLVKDEASTLDNGGAKESVLSHLTCDRLYGPCRCGKFHRDEGESVRKALARQGSSDPQPELHGTRFAKSSGKKLGEGRTEDDARPGDPTVRHVVAWMRATYPQNEHAREWADEIDHVFLGKPRAQRTKEASPTCGHGVAMTAACMTCISRGDDPRGDGFRPRTNEAKPDAWEALTRIRKLVDCSSLFNREKLLDELMGILDSTPAGCIGVPRPEPALVHDGKLTEHSRDNLNLPARPCHCVCNKCIAQTAAHSVCEYSCDLRTRETVTEPAPWRIGRKLARTIYFHDRCVGMVDTPGLAILLVTAANRNAAGPGSETPELTQENAEQVFRNGHLAGIERVASWLESLAFEDYSTKWLAKQVRAMVTGGTGT
jgi:hypothetical protein